MPPHTATKKSAAALNLTTARPTGEVRSERKVETCRHLITLWVVVTALWTTATVFRIDRVWVPRAGWDGVLHGSWLWLSLGVPPVIFALVVTYVCQVIRIRQRIVVAPTLRSHHEEH
jgi:hypothetical protein